MADPVGTDRAAGRVDCRETIERLVDGFEAEGSLTATAQVTANQTVDVPDVKSQLRLIADKVIPELD